jgi:hypothetical protein
MFFKLIGGKIWHEFHELARIEFFAAVAERRILQGLEMRLHGEKSPYILPLDSFIANFLTGGNQRPCSSPFQLE